MLVLDEADELLSLGFWPDMLEIQRSEEHTSELQSHHDLVCRLMLAKKKAKLEIQDTI